MTLWGRVVVVAEDVARRPRRLMAGRVDLREGMRKARPQILPKVKVTVRDVGCGKVSDFRRKKEGKGEGPWTREFHRNQR